MKGKILNFKAEKGFGFIIGEDNKKYFFHISNVLNYTNINNGYSVEFKSKKTSKGLAAVNINVLLDLKHKKDMLVKIGDFASIRASEIKSYSISEKRRKDFYDDGSFYSWGSDYTINIYTYSNGIQKCHIGFFTDADTTDDIKKITRKLDEAIESQF